MATESVNYQCIACGGTLHLDPSSGLLKCDYCESTFEPAQIEAAYSAKQEAQDTKAQEAAERAESGQRSAFEEMGDVNGASSALTQEVIDEAVSTSSTKENAIDAYLSRASWNEEERKGLRSFTCSSCGAGLTVDATTAVTACPYCGNTAVVAGTFINESKPDYVIPFKMTKEQAVDSLNGFYKGKKFLPSKFSEGNKVEHIQGVYVPFWLYDADAQGQGNFVAKRVRTYTIGDEQVTETDVYNAYRAGNMSFSRVPVDCSNKMPDGHMDAIEPFDYSEIKPFSVAYMPGYLAERYDEDANQCKGRANKRMENSLEEELRGTVRGYSTVERGNVESNITYTKLAHALLPVWMLHTRWEEKDYLFAMNGQTGRFVGDLPVSKLKVLIWFLAIFVVLGAALFCADYFYLHFNDATTSVLVDGGIPALVSALVCYAFYTQMKTAKEKTEARAYITPEGLNLTGSSDTFVTKHVSRVKIRDNDD